MDWSNFAFPDEAKNKIKIISSLPSFSTPVCDLETRRFNQEAAALGENIVIIMVSMDLPFTLATWCASAGVDKVITLSDHLKLNLAKVVLLIRNYASFEEPFCCRTATSGLPMWIICKN
jgi:peroxiredoxin